MVFHRRSGRMSLRPINRIKHVIDSQFATAVGTQVNVDLASTTDTPTLAVANSVETGSKINGIYLKVEISPTSEAALANAYFFLYKNVGGNTTAPIANVVGTSDNKRFVFHQEMVMNGDSVNKNPRTVFNGVIAIPRGYRANRPNDLLQAFFLSPGITANWCIQCHYKEFR